MCMVDEKPNRGLTEIRRKLHVVLQFNSSASRDYRLATVHGGGGGGGGGRGSLRGVTRMRH